MFLLWPQAAADMLELLRQDQLPGIPQAPATIAEILGAAGVIEPGRRARSCGMSLFPPPRRALPQLESPPPCCFLPQWTMPARRCSVSCLNLRGRQDDSLNTCTRAAHVADSPTSRVTPVPEPTPAQQRPHDADEASLAQAPRRCLRRLRSLRRLDSTRRCVMPCSRSSRRSTRPRFRWPLLSSSLACSCRWKSSSAAAWTRRWRCAR